MLVFVFAVATAITPPQHYEFDNDVVEADVVGPQSEVVSSAAKPKHVSLIRVRQHFIEELIQSANR